MSERKLNFNAGPGALPFEVLEEVQAEMHDWHGSGVSVATMSHRDEFGEITHEAEHDLRALLGITNDYSVLFLHGGATGQFSAIPLNLTTADQTADYSITGFWGKKAFHEASKQLAKAPHIAVKTDPHIYVPPPEEWQLSDHAAYLHITPNETIDGVRFSSLPESAVPIVADMSSSILSEPLIVENYGVIYAGAQKNIGIAGLAVVIVKNELLGRARKETPGIWDWEAQAKAGSMLNTPPTVPLYVAGLVLKWLIGQGGTSEIATVNERKAQKLYATIDGLDLYTNPVATENRSRMNVPFTIGNASLEAVFLEEARRAGMKGLAGHKSVGGLRASLYNAVPESDVDSLVAFMRDFAERHQ